MVPVEIRSQPVERLVAGGAFVIALATALLAFYTFRAEREHDRLSVRPAMAIDRNLDLTFGPLALTLRNAGLGPARIEWITVYANGSPIELDRSGQWNEVLAIIGTECGLVSTTWYQRGDPFDRGKVSPLAFLPPSLTTPETVKKAETALRNLGVEVCYCSMYNECFIEPENREKLSGRECVSSRDRD